MKQPFVLAVCGPSGAGKSTLIEAIKRRHGDATSLALDEYESVSHYPDTAAWLADGADPNGFESPQFIADMQALIKGQPVIPPDAPTLRTSSSLLLVEEPFGRERSAVAPLLNAVVYLSLPADVALARKLSRNNAFFPWHQDAEKHLANLRGFLMWYLDQGRDFARAIEQRVMPTSDLVLDAEKPTEELAEKLLAWFAKQ